MIVKNVKRILNSKNMTINKIISDRWSPVAFSDRVPVRDQIALLFEAARRAPSSYNAQPWKFIYGFKGDEVYTVLFDLINETNQVWAKTAPVLILSMAETIPPGRTSLNRFAFHDTGMAVGNLLAQATDLGLFVHQMGGYDNESAKTVLNLPATYEPLAMMAVGYKGDPAVLPEAVAAREEKRSERNPLEKFAFNRKI
jgi:nitroreductase